MTTPARPRPILDAMTNGGAIITLAGSVIAAGVALGVLSTAQANTATVLLAALGTALPAITALAVQVHILHAAEPLVTPLSSPMDSDGTPLVRPLAAPAKPEPGEQP